jgi:hypothetical protein
MHITDKTTRAELEQVITDTPDLLAYLGTWEQINAMTTDSIRERITDWIIEGDETHNSAN